MFQIQGHCISSTELLSNTLYNATLQTKIMLYENLEKECQTVTLVYV